MTSLARMLALLDAFTPARYAWTVDDLAGHFGYTAASTYRYVKVLSGAGLLMRLPGGIYVIGARFIELESLIRDADPVKQVATPVLRELVEQTGCDVLLSNVYGDHLINVVHEGGVESLGLSYLRGRKLPWFKGSPSKAVLAFLPRTRVRQLYEAAFGAQPDEEHWAATVKELKAVRKAGYCVSVGELDVDVVGFGAPVILDGDVIGSVSLTCSTKRADLLNHESMGKSLTAQCAELARRLSNKDVP